MIISPAEASPEEDVSDERTEVQPAAPTPSQAVVRSTREHTPLVAPPRGADPAERPAPTPPPARIQVAVREPPPPPPPVVAPPSPSIPERIVSAPHFAAAPAYPALTAAEAAVVARTLDFRKVGIATWRARTRGGRTLDFADTRSLRACLADGRLSPQDSISVDGYGWVPIEAIADLDSYFVATWEELNAARGGPPPDWSHASGRAQLNPPPGAPRPTAPAPVPTRAAAPQPIVAPQAPVLAPVVAPVVAPTPAVAPRVIPQAGPPPPLPSARPAPAEPLHAVAPRAPAPWTPPPPPRTTRWFEVALLVVAVLFVFVFGVGVGAFMLNERASAPAPVATTPGPAAPIGAAEPGPPKPSAIPTYTVGGTHSVPTASPTASSASTSRSTTPDAASSAPAINVVARTPLTGRPTDALSAATRITPSVAPGEGAPIEGTENIGKPSDLVQVQEIPPEQAEAVLRREGLK